ncbi:MAG: hypothetical protein AB7O59_02355 [Pirellulales bacterium]
MAFRLHKLAWGAARTFHPLQWARVACGRRLDWIRHDNFLVLSAVRSGTCLLQDYLNCSGRIRCYGEIIGADQPIYGNAYGMSPERLRLHVESFFVKRPGRMVGAKIMTFHLDELTLKLPELYEMLARPKIVVLYRGNILEQFASFKLAMHYGVWHVNKPKHLGTITLDPDEFLAFAERERRMWRENLAALGDVGADVHVLSYERLAGWPEPALREVFEFLGVPAVPAHSRLVRTNPQPPWRKISNYDEFVARGIPETAVLELPTAAQIAAPKAAWVDRPSSVAARHFDACREAA